MKSIKGIFFLVSTILVPVMWFIWGCLWAFLPGGNMFFYGMEIKNMIDDLMSSSYINQSNIDYMLKQYNNAMAVFIMVIIFGLITLIIATMALAFITQSVIEKEKHKKHELEKFKRWKRGEVEHEHKHEEEFDSFDIHDFKPRRLQHGEGEKPHHAEKLPHELEKPNQKSIEKELEKEKRKAEEEAKRLESEVNSLKEILKKIKTEEEKSGKAFF
jgi:hypothetical protein